MLRDHALLSCRQLCAWHTGALLPRERRPPGDGGAAGGDAGPAERRRGSVGTAEAGCGQASPAARLLGWRHRTVLRPMVVLDAGGAAADPWEAPRASDPAAASS